MLSIQLLGVLGHIDLPMFHERLQRAFSDHLLQCHVIEQQFPTELLGATQLAQLTSNPRNQAAEQFAQNFMIGAIGEALESKALAVRDCTVNRDNADVWSGQLVTRC